MGLTSCPSNLVSVTAQWWDTTTGVNLTTSPVACVNVSGTWSLQLAVPTIGTAHGDYAFKINIGAVTTSTSGENTSSSSAATRSSFIQLFKLLITNCKAKNSRFIVLVQCAFAFPTPPQSTSGITSVPQQLVLLPRTTEIKSGILNHKEAENEFWFQSYGASTGYIFRCYLNLTTS